MANGDTAPPSPIPLPANPGVAQSLPPPREAQAPQQIAQNFPPRVPQNYIPTNNQPWFGGRSMNELGTPTPDISGLSGYPGWPNTAGFPQMRDIPSVIGGLAQNFGRFGPPGVGNPMLQAGLGMQGITKDYIAGQLAQLKVNRGIMENQLFNAQLKAEEILRDYQEIYHLYGPELDANGKVIKPGEPKRFHEALLEAARNHGDRYLQTALENGDYKAADRYLRWFDGNKQDLDKLNRLLDIEKKKLEIQKLEDEAKGRGDIYHEQPGVPSPGATTPKGIGPGGRGGPAPGDIIPEEPETPSPSPGPSPPAPPSGAIPGTSTGEAQPEQPAPPNRLAALRQGAGGRPLVMEAPPLGSAENPDVQAGINIRPVNPAERNQLGGMPQVAQGPPTPPSGSPTATDAGGPSIDLGGGITAREIRPELPKEDLTISTPRGAKDPNFKTPRLYGLPPPPDKYTDIGLPPAQIWQYAQQWLQNTSRRLFVGAAHDPYAALKEAIVQGYANQIQNYTDKVIQNIGWHDPETSISLIDRAMPGTGALLRRIGDGAAPIPSGYANNSVFWQKINKYSSELFPQLTNADFPVYQRTKMAFDSGSGAFPAVTIAATDRALQHSIYLMELAHHLHNNRFPLSNASRQFFRTQFGSDAPTNFDTVVRHVAQELTRAFRGNGGALRDIESELQKIGSSRSPQQIAGYLRAVAHLLYGQLDALNDLYKRGTNDHERKHPLDWLSPTGQQAFLILRQIDASQIQDPSFFNKDYRDAATTLGRGSFGRLTIDPDKGDRDAAAQPHSFVMGGYFGGGLGGYTISDPGVTYSDVPAANQIRIPRWPGTDANGDSPIDPPLPGGQ